MSKTKTSRKRGDCTIAVPASWDATTSTLQVEPSRVAAQCGDRLFFEIKNLGEAWTPAFRITEGKTHKWVAWTQWTSSGLLVQLRDDATPGVFAAALRIQQGLGVGGRTPTTIAWSPDFHLDLVPKGSARNHVFRVLAGKGGESLPAQGTLRVVPQLIGTKPHDTVEWDFSQLDLTDSVPIVIFDRYLGPAESEPVNSALGPFMAIRTTRTSVLAAGHNDKAGSYFFKVAVARHDTGAITWITSKDPAVDSMGSPDSPGGGG